MERQSYVTVDILEADAVVPCQRRRTRDHGRADAEMLPKARRLARARVAPKLDGAAVVDDAIVNPAIAVNVGQTDAALLGFTRHNLSKVLKSW